MDWDKAIEWHGAALRRVVATLFAMAGLEATFTSLLRGEVAARSDAGGGGDAAHPTPALRADPPPPGESNALRPTLPRRLHRAVLRLLRPAESAMRRLIVISARGLVVAPSPLRFRKPAPPSIFLPGGSRATGIIPPRGTPARPPGPAPASISLPLFDRMKRPFERRRPTPVCAPRISCAATFARLSPVKIRRPPVPHDMLDATRLTLRLQALAAALDDLPKQARRLARWRANRERDRTRDAAGVQNSSGDAEAQFLAPAGGGAPEGRARPVARPGTVARAKPETVRGPSATSRAKAPPRIRRTSPLRPGRPPGSPRRPDHDVHKLLTDLHGLAFDALNDTS